MKKTNKLSLYGALGALFLSVVASNSFCCCGPRRKPCQKRPMAQQHVVRSVAMQHVAPKLVPAKVQESAEAKIKSLVAEIEKLVNKFRSNRGLQNEIYAKLVEARRLILDLEKRDGKVRQDLRDEFNKVWDQFADQLKVMRASAKQNDGEDRDGKVVANGSEATAPAVDLASRPAVKKTPARKVSAQQNNAAAGELKNLREQLAAKNADVAKLKQELGQLQANSQKRQDEPVKASQDLQQQLIGKDAEIAALRRELDQLHANSQRQQDLQEKLTTRAAEVSNLKQELVQLRNGVQAGMQRAKTEALQEASNAMRQEFENRIMVLNEDLERLQTEKTNLQIKLNGLLEASQDAKKAQQLQQLNAELQKNITDSIARVQELETSLRQAEQALETSLRQAKNDKGRLNAEKDRLQRENNAEKDRLQRENGELQAELARVSWEWAASIDCVQKLEAEARRNQNMRRTTELELFRHQETGATAQPVATGSNSAAAAATAPVAGTSATGTDNASKVPAILDID